MPWSANFRSAKLCGCILPCSVFWCVMFSHILLIRSFFSTVTSVRLSKDCKNVFSVSQGNKTENSTSVCFFSQHVLNAFQDMKSVKRAKIYMPFLA